MATIYLSLSTKANKVTGESEILIRFKHGRIAQRTKSGIYIHSENWDHTNNKIKIPKSRIKNALQIELSECDTKLSELCSIIMATFQSADTSQVNKEWIETIIDNYNHPNRAKESTEIRQSFFEAFTEFLIAREYSTWRLKAFNVVIRSLKRFELYIQATENKSFRLDLDDITHITVGSYVDFLRDEHIFFNEYPKIYTAVPESRTPQPRGQHTINGILTKLRTFFIYCNTTNKTNNNPFKHYTIAECEYGTPYCISIDERNGLYKMDFSDNKQLETQRDIFIFQCVIGCRVGDLYKLTKASIIMDTKINVLCVEYIARKTKAKKPITVRVPLNSIALELLDKYKDVEGNKLFPFISEQKYNIYIKQMFSDAGLTRPITLDNTITGITEQRPLNELASSHLARRCFIGNMYLQIQDPNIIGAMSGHIEGSKAFARYRDIDMEIKLSAVKGIEKPVKKKRNSKKSIN